MNIQPTGYHLYELQNKDISGFTYLVDWI